MKLSFGNPFVSVRPSTSISKPSEEAPGLYTMAVAAEIKRRQERKEARLEAKGKVKTEEEQPETKKYIMTEEQRRRNREGQERFRLKRKMEKEKQNQTILVLEDQKSELEYKIMELDRHFDDFRGFQGCEYVPGTELRVGFVSEPRVKRSKAENEELRKKRVREKDNSAHVRIFLREQVDRINRPKKIAFLKQEIERLSGILSDLQVKQRKKCLVFRDKNGSVVLQVPLSQPPLNATPSSLSTVL